ncbi:protein MFI isoform 3, partial [Daubentonia madagascariensis]
RHKKWSKTSWFY